MLATPSHWHSHSNAGLFSVVALHLCALWLLARSGVLVPSQPHTVLTVSLLAKSAAVEPESERTPPPPRPAQRRSPPAPQSAPLSFVTEVPAESAPVPAATAPAPAAASTATAMAPDSAPPAPSAPRFDADYLQNPAPAYPSLSRRLGEEGKVVLRVFVDPSRRPSQVEIKTSSASERLDQAAQDAVRRWKFTPARRGDEAVAAWVLVPIVFNLRG